VGSTAVGVGAAVGEGVRLAVASRTGVADGRAVGVGTTGTVVTTDGVDCPHAARADANNKEKRTQCREPGVFVPNHIFHISFTKTIEPVTVRCSVINS